VANAPGFDRLIYLRSEAARELPKKWLTRIAEAAKAAAAKVKPLYKHEAAGDVWAWWACNFAGASGADLTEQSIRDRAQSIAKRAAHVKADKACINAFVERYGGKPLVEKRGQAFVDFWKKRIECERWWRGQIRRWVVQQYERGEIKLGFVGAKAGAWYCSDRAVRRRIHQVRASEAMMRATVIESTGGERVTLWDASQATTANKEIRRGELMTRIRGCEEWADSEGLIGLFTTNTAPSRFHAAKHGGGINKKYDDSTPDMAQAWLNQTWARCRAQLHRQGVKIMGFRVAEPHHDGCPHWHMLIWVKPEQEKALRMALVDHWLREDEFGAGRNRLKIKRMIKGGAAGYVAKYIAKNINDNGIKHHEDADEVPNYTLEAREDGELIINPSMRVEAWAACWRIRQFQAIGQPPVTVWRELRRVTREAAAGGSDTLIMAWLAVHRRGDKKASWLAYMQAQGGAMRKRDAYHVTTFNEEKTTNGRYGQTTAAWTSGVRDRTRDTAHSVTPTKREAWGAEGFSRGHKVPAWTRWNNCTRAKLANRKNLTPELDKARVWQDKDVDNFEVDTEKAEHYDKFWAAIMPNCG
jgi:Bacteriophage replication gene A protein (GPA)